MDNNFPINLDINNLRKNSEEKIKNIFEGISEITPKNNSQTLLVLSIAAHIAISNLRDRTN
tara:strand:+ start:3413 stop:3595 length:183 start_codon:yes stop_codon:yes gene_type:complete